MLFKWIVRRQSSADLIVLMLRSQRKLGLMQEMLKVFRFKITRIQREWRSRLQMREVKVLVILAKCEREKSWAKLERSRLNRAIVELKDDKDVTTHERVSRREELYVQLVSASRRTCLAILWANYQWLHCV